MATMTTQLEDAYPYPLHTSNFPLLELPILVIEKILSYITDPFDLKAVRRSCKDTRDIISKNPGSLIYLKVTPKDLKDLEHIVKNESEIRWNNFRFPPELYYIGCRRQYVETFNRLFAEFTEVYASYIETLEMDRFDLSNPCHINLLRRCQRLVSFKVDAMMLKGVSEQGLNESLEDESIISVLRKLQYLDVVAFEFLQHEYQFQFMGKVLHKCTNLRQVGSWGYFPEWEQPVGGRKHLEHFIWPLLCYLRKRIQTVDLMLETTETYKDFVEKQLQLFNERMDWQAGKWVVDLRKDSESDYSGIENFLYSRITSYVHRAVGWFDEFEFLRCGLPLMVNLSSVHIHNARDINLTGENPLSKTIFKKLESITLIVGNRLTTEDNQNLALEKIIVSTLLNTQRPSVTSLKLDIDLDHHHEHGSIDLPLILHNFPNLISFSVEEWGPTDRQMLAVYEAFPCLEVLMFCGRNLSDVGILGRDGESSQTIEPKGMRKLSSLRILKMFSIRLPPKNVFPWPINENNRITNISFEKGFSQLPCLRKFHFLLKSDMITEVGIRALLEGQFAKTGVEFLLNWLPRGVGSAHDFEGLNETFKFLDPQTFLEPANFVIPDIGKWVV